MIGLLESWECVGELLRSFGFHPCTPPSHGLQEKKRVPRLFLISNHSRRIFFPNSYLASHERLLNSLIKDRLRNVEIFIFKNPSVYCK